MAKIGLNFGDKLKIADKEYRVVSDGLDLEALLGRVTWRRYEEPIPYTVPDETQTPDRFGRYPEKPTGEIKWEDVSIFSEAQGKTLFVSIVDMPAYVIEELGLKLGDEIELEDLVVTYSYLDRRDVYKLFASKIKKKGVGTPSQAKPEQKAEKKAG